MKAATGTSGSNAIFMSCAFSCALDSALQNRHPRHRHPSELCFLWVCVPLRPLHKQRFDRYVGRVFMQTLWVIMFSPE